MRTIFNTITAVSVAGIMVAGSMLDSASPLPFVVCAVCVAWLGVIAYAQTL